MTTITVEPVTTSRWDDLQHALSGGGDGRSCQCIWPIVRNRVWQETNLDQRREMLREEIAAGPPPGLIAYVDAQAAGWIRFGPRPTQQRVVHTRAIAAATSEPLDDETVWCVTCFVVRKAHRGTGLTRVLLAAAIDHARERGARLIEAYPVDTSAATHRSNDLFHGTLSTFLSAGFERVSNLTAGRVLVTRGLAD